MHGIIVSMIRTRSVVASVVAWTVGACIALAVSLLALSTVDLSTEPFRPATRDIGAANPSTPTPSRSATSVDVTAEAGETTPTTGKVAANERSLSFAGGTVVAHCRNGGAYLVYWSPAPGYHVDDVVRGPADPARLTFEGRGNELKVAITCVTGTPQATTRQKDHTSDS